jgi:hypothetical protein
LRTAGFAGCAGGGGAGGGGNVAWGSGGASRGGGITPVAATTGMPRRCHSLMPSSSTTALV